MKIINNAKSIISTDLIEIISSVLISALLEISRAIVDFIISVDETITVSMLQNVFTIDVWDSIDTIILLTLIIWGVTGLSKIMDKSNHGKRKKLHTLFTLMSFISCIIWYIIKKFFVVNITMIIVTSFLSIILLVLLTSYFVDNEEISKYKSDNRIA